MTETLLDFVADELQSLSNQSSLRVVSIVRRHSGLIELSIVLVIMMQPTRSKEAIGEEERYIQMRIRRCGKTHALNGESGLKYIDDC